MEKNICDVTTDTFEHEVIEASRSHPVLVDFWAEWCAPCKALKPILEKLARERGDFVLAKVDTDREPQLAAKFGIRSIPNVKAFIDGKLVDEFSGVLPEAAVCAFLAKIIPSAAQKLRIGALAAVRAGEFEHAESKLEEALKMEPNHADITLDLVELLLARQAYSEAALHIDRIPERERTGRVDKLAMRIERWKKAQRLPDLHELEAKLRESPQNQSLRLQLADRHIAEGAHEAALELLIEVARRDRGALRDEARRAMVDVFRIIGEGSELASRYRRLLSSALY